MSVESVGGTTPASAPRADEHGVDQWQAEHALDVLADGAFVARAAT